ncbi:PLP-dependent aminotransferase family protein [Paenibacillus sediminis]|uniref:GntR family transcriptional regulator/MocR family aminotransferase n=1 Tax=Paenibacillus sediminis TaxID=664909 RepID=A0ABS4H699_9BACL|nr:PLP-dependent aminotransferase family protein [Paenibacillus sediminis]MBP1937887.1 GntR family transcriptional regulator/MocR family aminotransferase [Paenibacillus sediminis]
MSLDFTLPFQTCLETYHYKYLALYHAFRIAIYDGTLRAGTKLPSSRELAKLYGLSRGSVGQTYEMLMADGYVRSEVGRGTFVTENASSASPNKTAAELTLSAWGERMMKPDSNVIIADDWLQESTKISFIASGASMDHFPYLEWKSALSYAAKEIHLEGQQGHNPAGDYKLRETIASHLRRSRGINAEADQVVLFSGSMQAIALLCQLLLGAGDQAVVEEPGYHGIRRAIYAFGAKAIPAQVNEQGIMPADWEAKVLFVTTSRQFPTGAVLSLQRRRELLAWARRKNAVIIEDDYDSEFRWGGRPIEPLKALDEEDRVIYIGTFSKTMFTDLRIGYAVLPRSLIRPVYLAKGLYDPLPPALLEQRALARFMSRGEYERHLRRMRRVYGARHDLFCTLMKKYASDLFTLLPADAGLHVYTKWRRSAEEYAAFRAAAKQRGLVWRDASLYHTKPAPPAACFNFAHLSEDQIKEGVHLLRQAWQDVQDLAN